MTIFQQTEADLWEGEWRDGLLFTDAAPAGSGKWVKNASGQIVALRFVCPCGCKAVGAVPVFEGYNRDTWDWNGSLEKPTLTPSVQRMDACRWHGYLTNGEWRTC